jgi:5-oxoprolinase (ATP-hydrolysing)
LNETGKKTLSIEEIALGFIRVANESMSRPIRALTEVKNIKGFNDHQKFS